MSTGLPTSTKNTDSSMDINDHQRDIEIVNNDRVEETLYTSDYSIDHPPPVGLNGLVKEHVKECRKRCISRLKIVWAFVSFLLSVADVTVIIYLSYLHFHHSQDLMAWLMLLPIVLNFIGIFTFLSK